MEDALYRCRNKFDKMSDRKRYYVAYTVCFIVVSLGGFYLVHVWQKNLYLAG